MRAIHVTAALLLATTLIVAGCATGKSKSASATDPAAGSASPMTLGSLAGKWDGWAKPASGNSHPIELTVNPDGTYTSRVGASSGTGTFQIVGNKILTQGHLTGSAFGSTGASEVAHTTKDGRQKLTGDGRSDAGPYSFEVMKRN
jgi:hypothetical protein